MKCVQARIVDALELACRSTRLVEWLPGWHRVYPQCLFARWSNELDHRWAAGRWEVHDADGAEAWEAWWESLGSEGRSRGCWHHW